MNGKTVWRNETKRFVIMIVESPNWKGGKPIDPAVPKWLIKIRDKFLKEEYCPTDEELVWLAKTMSEDDLKVLSQALLLKEKHNRMNLKNPEKRPVEDYIHSIVPLRSSQPKKLPSDDLADWM